MRVFEMLVSFGKRNFHASSLSFYTIRRYFTPVQTHQFIYQHQSYSAATHFQVDNVASPEIRFKHFVQFFGRDTYSCILNLYGPVIFILVSGYVYFKALEMIFFKIESIFSLSNHTFR